MEKQEKSKLTSKDLVNNMTLKNDRINLGVRNIVLNCGNLKKNERVCLIYDKKTEDLIPLFLNWIKKRSSCFKIVKEDGLIMHGSEPSMKTAYMMKNSDLIFALTSFSIAHTNARINASIAGARFLSLPEYSLDLIQDNSITQNFKKCFVNVRKMTKILSLGNKVKVLSDKGTNIDLDIKGRFANCCPGYVCKPGDLSSPPDVESNISPCEFKSNGKIIVDGSIPHPSVGLLNENVELSVEDGFITKIKTGVFLEKKIKSIFNSVPIKKTKILAECGIGFNPKAKLKGYMLIDEGAFGTMHFGFGSNITVGGLNDVPFHLDFVLKRPSMFVDDELVIKKGKPVF